MLLCEKEHGKEMENGKNLAWKWCDKIEVSKFYQIFGFSWIPETVHVNRLYI